MKTLILNILLAICTFSAARSESDLHVGVAAVEFIADDSMPIAGSILPGKVKGQEGKLRAVAVVLEKPGQGKLAIVTCDILMITRDLLDPVVRQIEKATGIPGERVLINCTHTHHAPSTVRLHGYDRVPAFCEEVQRKIVQAVTDANTNLSKDRCEFFFHLGHEETVGMNSRLMLGDRTIYWTGDRGDEVRPTGPFDPELPVLAFRDSNQKLKALLFNHSTHTIGVLTGAKRSPSFYGLAAQELEAELGGITSFIEGASGSTHNLSGAVPVPLAIKRIKDAVKLGLSKAQPLAVDRLAAIKRPFTFKVRHFDEAKEDAAITAYTEKRMSPRAASTIEVFRKMRADLAPQQAEERTTWLQVTRIGDVAVVGIPAEFFAKLGLDIKNRSPFPRTYIAGLANDWIGYVPDQDAFKLGGYQVWTGFHSYCEPGTGERMVETIIEMLNELR
jgi:molybdopterin-guanine dinucleotide biosynthesis protein A